jgi:Tfp pilus assembly protein PilO
MARKKSYKNKIIVSTTLLIVTYLALFGYVFPMVDKKNEAQIAKVTEKKTEYQNLLSEKKSFELGQRDLKLIASKAYQPKDLFNTDKFLVNAVEQLEQAARLSDVSFALQVAGKTDSITAKGQKTASGLVIIPYSMDVKGSFGNVVAFMERLEHMPFITHSQGVDLSNQPNNQVGALIKAQFFIRK